MQFGGDFSLLPSQSGKPHRQPCSLAGGARDYRSEDDIYRTAYAPRWTDWFDPARTLRVDVSATKSPLTSLNFVTLKIKDAVCDKIRRIAGRRPNVDTREPDIPIQGHLSDREFTLYLDTTGSPSSNAASAFPRVKHRSGKISPLELFVSPVGRPAFLCSIQCAAAARSCSKRRTWLSISRLA